MTAGPRRRNVRPEIAAARARLGAAVREADAEAIAAARADLASAKARAAVRELLTLPAAERMQLAGLLLTGSGDAA
jgi:hypothetical protein